MKFITFLAITLFTLCVALYLGWPYLKIGFASNAHYTDKDKIEYEYYTPEVLKKMPRISHSYEFTYTNISGPQAYVFSINYRGVLDINPIHEYLTSEGYFLQETCDVEAECWRSYSNNDVISISKFYDPNEVLVDVYRSDHTIPLGNHQ